MTLANWIEPTKADDSGTNSAKPRKRELPWSEKYRPESLIDVVGNPSSIEDVKKWAAQWATGKPKKKALLIYGRVGTGKTSLAYSLAKEVGWDVIEMNASDKRSSEFVEQIAGLGSQTRSFTGAKKVILVEEIDGLSGVADRGATQALADVIKKTEAPMILTSNDIDDKKLSGLKVYCEQVQLKKIAPGVIVKVLKDILEKEGVGIEDISALQKIADNADGDLRSAINDLQAIAQGETILKKDSVFLEQRDRQIDVYKAMQRIFRCTDYAQCRRVIWDLDEEPRNFIAWLDENIPVEYKTVPERAKAFNNLSRADVFLGRVTIRQYWGFLRYVNDLMTVGVGFAKDGPNFGFSQYNFPSLIRKMGMTRGKRAKEGAISGKMSPVVHESKRRIINDYLPLVQKVYAKNRAAGEAMVSKFGLDAEELEYFA